jgi:hypothetical protein
MPYEIKSWEEISERYRSAILLGNGASISISNRFCYDSLKEHAEDQGHITEAVSEVFRFFDTEDFELILRVLWQAQNVNTALGTEENRTTQTYREVRQALIETVRNIHPPQNDVGFPIEHISVFLRRFKHVLSLNYDLTVYWAMMVNQNNPEGHVYKDCFVKSVFDEDWERFSTPIGRQKNCTTVFYPHGNLALFRNRIEEERKIAAVGGNDLLETILQRWGSGDSVPLFVSEGTTQQKTRSIMGSSYLRTVLRSVIPSIETSLVVYGWGFGEHDAHIINALSRSSIERIAVSVYRGNQRFCDQVAGAIDDHFDRDVELQFFDAESEHCWARA